MGLIGRRIRDLTGQKFGRLLVISFSHIDEKQNARWSCWCECGNELLVRGFTLTGGKSRSCGCLQKEKVAEANRTHGLCGTPEYRVWHEMLRRCGNPKNPAFKDYGARGITVSDDWQTFENFIRDMGERPSAKHSIERIDNERGYSKGNCKWATRAEQSRNTRRNVRIDTPKGPMLISDAAIAFGIKRETITSRMRRGWTGAALFEPPRKT